MPANGCRVVFTGPGVAEMEQFDVPVPSEGQAVVRSERTVISVPAPSTPRSLANCQPIAAIPSTPAIPTWAWSRRWAPVYSGRRWASGC